MLLQHKKIVIAIILLFLLLFGVNMLMRLRAHTTDYFSGYSCPVESKLVGGKYLNCQPGDQQLPPYCEADQMKWIEKNCPDIEYAF